MIPCHWNKTIACDHSLYCNACSRQPPDDKKPNGRKAPVRLRWVPSFNGMTDSFQPAPECPACGEMPYSTEHYFFCGQRFLEEETT
jgi:hypothetical protein